MSKFLDFKKISDVSFVSTRLVYCLDVTASFVSSVFVLFMVSLIGSSIAVGHVLQVWLVGALLSSAVIFRLGRIYRSIIRYSGLYDLLRLGGVCLAKDFVLWILMALFTSLSNHHNVLAFMVVLDLFVTVCALTFTRVVMVVVYNSLRSRSKEGLNAKHVLIYGIGDKSVSAMAHLKNSRNYEIEGFIVPGKAVDVHTIGGKRVFSFTSLAEFQIAVDKTGIEGILFPYVKDAREEKNRLIGYCRETGMKTYVIPDFDEITDTASMSKYIRKVRIEDLLGRQEIEISMDEIIANFHDKTVMVTGAAGSIGSELCRQLAALGVNKLILFDNAETPLHNIRLELEDSYPELDFAPVIGDVRDTARLDYVFEKFHPHVVFHAAAYKHVPLMEENPCEAVRVNLTGSRQVADKCVEYDVELMVMISTDKAVNPTNIMGCTKRLAEIYVQSLGLAIEKGEVKGRTRFVTTRFGNVLGSNGSVIPRFRAQIEQGGPVTVTHPEIRRFFMTIPEACRLVLEAATFSTATQIFVFDMGESVKISTLAERMISLAGLVPDRDIKIEYTGLRPGEKLYEEVLATKENTIPTDHERIFVAKVREYDYGNAVLVTDNLGRFASNWNIPEMVILMKQTVPEFKSKHSEFEKYDK